MIAAGAIVGSIASCGRGTPTATAGHPRITTASTVAYIDRGSLWIYEVASNENRRLASPSEEPGGVPRWIGDQEVTYVAKGDSDSAIIRAIDAKSLRRRDIVKESGIIWSHDVSPDGTTIAYLLYGVDGKHHVKVAMTNTGRPSVLRTLGQVFGRGADSEDEVSIAWSPDGKSLLVTDTHIEAKDQIHVIDVAGTDVVPPRSGTHARWSWDGDSIYFRGSSSQGSKKWKELDLATREEKPIPMKEGANNLTVAPGGARLAYDDSVFGDVQLPGSAPNVDVFDVDGATTEVMKRGALAPIWISPSEVLVTDARARTDDGSLNSWEPTGTVTKIGLDGKTTRVTMTSTLRAAGSFRATAAESSAATASPTSEKALATYVDPWNRFSFEYPRSWTPREPTSADAAWTIQSYDPAALERGEYPGCAGPQDWCQGITKIEGWTGDASEPHELKNPEKVRLSTGQIGLVISYDGNPKDDQYSESTLDDFARSDLAYVALLYVVDGSTSYQFSLWSGDPRRPGETDPPGKATFTELISTVKIPA